MTKVVVSQGAVDLQVWDDQTNTYLINPKAENFTLDVWVEEAVLTEYKFPITEEGRLANHVDGVFHTQ